jgi:hypothetical protein
VRYVDVASRFEGHGVGSEAPWIHGRTFLTAPYHPTAKGQKAYAAAIRTALI